MHVAVVQSDVKRALALANRAIPNRPVWSAVEPRT